MNKRKKRTVEESGDQVVHALPKVCKILYDFSKMDGLLVHLVLGLHVVNSCCSGVESPCTVRHNLPAYREG